MSLPQTLEVVENTDPIYTANVTKDGVAFPLTGCELTLVVKKASSTPDDDADDVIFTYTLGSGIELIDELLGETEIQFDSANLVAPAEH